MKQKQLKRQERRNSSLLLKVFALLALMLCSVNGAWAEEVHASLTSDVYTEKGVYDTDAEKSASTNLINFSSQTLSWTKNDVKDPYATFIVSMVVPGHEGGWTKAQDWSAYEGIRLKVSNLSSGATFKLVIKANDKLFEWTMYNDYCLDSGYKTLSFSNTNGFKCNGTSITTEDLKSVTDIRISGASSGEGSVKIEDFYLYKTDYTITLKNNDNSASNSSKFTIGSNNYVAEGSNTASFGVTDKASGSKQVTFTATPTSGKLFWRWKFGTDESNYTWEYGSPVTKTVDDNLTCEAQFVDGVHYIANVGTNFTSLGSVTVKKGDDDKGTDYHSTPYNGGIKFVATPNTGCFFDGWFTDAACTAPFYDNDNKTGESNATLDLDSYLSGKSDAYKYNGLTLYAKFTQGYQVNAQVSPSGLTPAITIHQRSQESWGITNGGYVRPGTTAVFHVADVANYTFDGWYNGDTKLSDTQNEYDYGNVNSNITLTAKFSSTIDARIIDPSTNGSVSIGLGWEKILESGAKELNSEESVTKYGGLSVSVDDGSVVKAEIKEYRLVKLTGLKAGSTTVTLSLSGHAAPVTFTVTVSNTLLTIGKPECNHYGDRTNGDNYFDINKLNPSGGVTIGVADNGTGKKINVPSNGGSIKYVFDNAYNLKDLTGWTISNNADLRARVKCIRFYSDADDEKQIADFWGTPGQRSGISDSRFSDDNKVKAIRIDFKGSDTNTTYPDVASFDIDWIRFTIEHRDNIVPTLTDGTESEMIIRVGETLKLSNTPGYWRQYTDDTYQNVKKDGLTIDGFPSVVTFANMQAGDYYFAAADQYWCPLYGGDHGQSDLTKVHVKVTDDFLVKATTDPEGLNATFTIKNNGTDVTNPGFVPNTGSNATFGVSNVDGYEFVGWYFDGVLKNTDAQAAYSYGNVTKDVVAVAKFKKSYNNTDFTGYFPFINRLRAQWNFDQCDNDRLNVAAMNASSKWTKSEANYLNGNGYIEYTYNEALDFGELTYQTSSGDHEIPISAGIKFKANADEVSFRVNYKDGKMTGVNLVCKSGVRMTIPYMENSCRNDRGENYPKVVRHSAEQIAAARAIVFAAGYVTGTDTESEKIAKGNFTAEEIAAAKEKVNASGYVQGSDLMAECAATKEKECYTTYLPDVSGFENCMHHMKRDILYVALEGGKNWTWGDNNDGGYFVDNAIDRNGNFVDKAMFYPAGEENVNGVHWYKNDFLGVPGDPCTFELRHDAVFDRLAVNRNLTASYYTEYIDKMGYDTPMPGMRIRVDTKGLRVASDGSTSGYWDGAISMTYGGWALNGMKYKSVDGIDVTDSWSENTKYSTGTTDVHRIPTVSDGFPVISNMLSVARNENLNPSSNVTAYHPANPGNFKLSNYAENVTPWSLPCRGAYVKFEPTHPGVLNIHVVQEAEEEYFIADEFGKIDTQIDNTMTWAKAATEDVTVTRNSSTGGWKSSAKDYVKYSFNVYPGKSYYFFSMDAALGFAGFFFEPYVCRINTTNELDREDILMTEWSFDDNTPYTGIDNVSWAPEGATQVVIGGQAIPGVKSTVVYSPKVDNPGSDKDNTAEWQPYTINYSRSAVKATYTRSSGGFKANTWTSICLPFSMNKYQMEDQFGAGTKVVMLRDIQDEKSGIPTSLTTANFIMHENQDIIAGYPYFIRPTKNTSSIHANVSLYGTTPTIPVVASQGVDANGASYNGIQCFQFTGNFTSTTVPKGSYVMANTGLLTRITNDVTAKPYRAYLKFVGTDYNTSAGGAKVIRDANYDFLADEGEDFEESTAIDELLFQSGIFAGNADVYNVNGQMVRANADNLQGLPKGIYIVNGKKFIVK